MIKLNRTCARSALVLLGTVGAAAAQEAPQLEEVVVTVTKRATTLQDTPVSVSAFDSTYLERNSIREFSDFASSIPNVSAPDGLTGTRNVAIRGISSPVRSGSGVEQPVGVYFDGVVVDNEALNGLILDVASIEVLRGPQGAIWGRNTPAGAILYRTQRPGEKFEGYLDADVGNYDLLQATAALSGPMAGEKVLFRLAAGHLERDGFTRRRSGGTLGNQDQDVVRGALTLRPTEGLDITLIAQRDWMDGYAGGHEYFTGPFAEISGTNGYAREVDTDFHVPSSRDTTALTGIVEYSMNDYVLTSVTGYRSYDIFRAGDTDATTQFVVNEISAEDTEQFSQELRLASPLEGRFDWMAGLYFYHQKQKSDGQTQVGPEFLGLPPGSQVTLDNAGTIRTRSYAAFGQANYHLTDALTARVGLRWTTDDKTADIAQRTIQIINVPPPAGPIDASGAQTFRGDYENSRFTPVVGLDFRAGENLMLFANAGKGYKAGGFNPGGTVRTTYGPENSTSYEIGVRSQWFSRKLTANATAFYVTYEDLQVQSFEGINPVFINAGEARSKGVELELLARLGSNWQLQGAFGFNDAEFKDFLIPGGAGGADLDLPGNRLPFAPRWNASVVARYGAAFANTGEIYAQAEWSYSADYWLDITNDPDGGRQGGFSLLNARVGIDLPGNSLEISVWGRNLTDRDYKADFVGNLPAALFGGSKFHLLAAPRTYGLNVRYRF
ncbi:MAG: TonB-dependent receptor [Steroidobacteraceae bacterium]|nr:TonB-dependent receptor [Steroidobacteraceae bacterium]